VDRALAQLRALRLHAPPAVHHRRGGGLAGGASPGAGGHGPGRAGRADRPRHPRAQLPPARGHSPAPGADQPRPAGRPRDLPRRLPAQAGRRDRLAAPRVRGARRGGGGRGRCSR
jgi:hypothetical protein